MPRTPRGCLTRLSPFESLAPSPEWGLFWKWTLLEMFSCSHLIRYHDIETARAICHALLPSLPAYC
jgi:hypothetical protein